MKSKYFFVLIGALLLSGRCFGAESQKRRIKQRMYAMSGQVLNPQEYYKIVDPLLDRAEQELKVFPYCLDHSDQSICRQYEDALLSFNVSVFQDYCGFHAPGYGFCQKRVREVIVRAAENNVLPQSEVDTEFKKTRDILYKGNEQFYAAAFPWYSKLFLGVIKILGYR